MVFPYGMYMEIYAKMAHPSAKQIPYGMDEIHMESAWNPPGMLGHVKYVPRATELDAAARDGIGI